MNVKYLLRRLPFSLIVWVIGGATCAFALYWLAGAAGSMGLADFSLYTAYLPYLMVVICTVVCIIGNNQSFAGLVWSMLFSVILCMSFIYATSVVLEDPTVSAALLANSAEGTTITPVWREPTRVGIRFLVSILIPLVVGMVFSWVHKRRHADEQPQSKKKMTKAEKRARRK